MRHIRGIRVSLVLVAALVIVGSACGTDGTSESGPKPVIRNAMTGLWVGEFDLNTTGLGPGSVSIDVRGYMLATFTEDQSGTFSADRVRACVGERIAVAYWTAEPVPTPR